MLTFGEVVAVVFAVLELSFKVSRVSLFCFFEFSVVVVLLEW
jgi:hypothetical protein